MLENFKQLKNELYSKYNEKDDIYSKYKKLN